MPALRTTLVAFALALNAFAASSSRAVESPALLEAEIARVGAPAKGVVGVAAWRLDGKGPRVSVNDYYMFEPGR